IPFRAEERPLVAESRLSNDARRDLSADHTAAAGARVLAQPAAAAGVRRHGPALRRSHTARRRCHALWTALPPTRTRPHARSADAASPKPGTRPGCELRPDRRRRARLHRRPAIDDGEPDRAPESAGEVAQLAALRAGADVRARPHGDVPRALARR